MKVLSFDLIRFYLCSSIIQKKRIMRKSIITAVVVFILTACGQAVQKQNPESQDSVSTETLSVLTHDEVIVQVEEVSQEIDSLENELIKLLNE